MEETEERGEKFGKEQGELKSRCIIAISILDRLELEMIEKITGLPIEE